VDISDKITAALLKQSRAAAFKEYTLNKNDENLNELLILIQIQIQKQKDLSEPFQFISIGLAKIDCLENERLGLNSTTFFIFSSKNKSSISITISISITY
jgi:hypothetical protein